jgi:Predicted transmembrane transcriptional regulator (anti-sigma factor)
MPAYCVNDHERANELACQHFAGIIDDAESRWLESHLASCPECTGETERMLAAISALKTVSITARAQLVENTQRQVRNLCTQTRQRRRRLRPIWISSALASAWMTCATPYLWQSFDLTGHWLHIPDLLWQMGFLVTWFTPAMTVAAMALWLRPQLTHTARTQANRATA